MALAKTKADTLYVLKTPQVLEAFGVLSVDRGNRSLVDSLLNVTVDWESQTLIDSGVVVVNRGNKDLFDSAGIQSVDRDNRVLMGSSGTFRIDWENRILNNGDRAISDGVSIGGGDTITTVITATATLDFPNTIAQTSSDLTITLTGAAIGDSVILGVDNASTEVNSSYSAWVSAADTVTVRFLNAGILARDPSSGTFRVTIIKF